MTSRPVKMQTWYETNITWRDLMRKPYVIASVLLNTNSNDSSIGNLVLSASFCYKWKAKYFLKNYAGDEVALLERCQILSDVGYACNQCYSWMIIL